MSQQLPCTFCGRVHRYRGFLYKQTNRINKKWYIGSHMGCRSDGYFGSGVILKKAIEKYGLDGFERTILRYHYGDQFELYAIEENYLIKIDAAGDRNSYNLKNKGLGQDPAVTSAIFKGRKKRPESIARQVASLEASGKIKGINNPRARGSCL